LLPNGKVLVSGGYSNLNNTPNFLNSAEQYDPATETWSTAGSFSPGRDRHAATVLANGNLLISGGLIDTLGNHTTNASLYNPATGTWTNTGPLATARERHTSTLLPNGKVLITGGAAFPVPGNGSIIAYYSSAELYDPVTGSWTSAGSMSVSRSDHTATLLPNGKVLIAGGETTNSSLATAELYDPATGTWTNTGSPSGVRARHSAALLPNGKVLAASGVYLNPSPGGYLTTAEIFDPAAGAWSAAAFLNAGRQHFAAALLANGNFLVAGGQNASGYLADAELYTSSNVTVTAISVTGQRKLSNGAFQFSFTNTPDVSFIVYCTSNASTRSSNWTAVSGLTEISPGHYQFSDPQAATNKAQFYRVRSP